MCTVAEAIIRLQAGQGTLSACAFNATVASQCTECAFPVKVTDRLNCWIGLLPVKSD